MKRILIGLAALGLLASGSASALSISGLTTGNLTAGVWGDGIAPEPGSILLLASGLAGLVAARSRR